MIAQKITQSHAFTFFATIAKRVLQWFCISCVT
jgi:hypothetical protein